jgi:hypothetical protein
VFTSPTEIVCSSSSCIDGFHRSSIPSRSFDRRPLCCRKIDRINPARVRRPYRRTGRDAFAPSPKILCQILQWNENPPIVGQRCAYLALGPAGRQHHVTCSPRWTASPLRPSLSFCYPQVVQPRHSNPRYGFLCPFQTYTFSRSSIPRRFRSAPF